MYVSNNYIVPTEVGYSLRRASDGSINTRRFKNTFDYSLDLIKLREVYTKVYRNRGFSFRIGEKEYTSQIINVTFKYSNKLFNLVGKDIYVRYGYDANHLEFNDCISIKDGKLVGIQINSPVISSCDIQLLEKCFYYSEEDHKYHAGTIPTLNTRENLRKELYAHGFWCDGIHYVRFKRSSGSARVGKCLFINERLYPKMHKWDMCGLKVTDGQEIDLAALESYISLSSSSIIDTLEIKPNNILVIDDYESIFTDEVIATREKDGHLESCQETVSIKNSIWDGQSLIDVSLLGDYTRYGMVLLRNRFFKSCCFNTNIQEWLLDNRITSIDQLNGFTLAEDIKDIKLITTPSSIKYLKFGSLEQWLENITSTFGIVKHDKKTHYFNGTMVKTHYQLINTLQMTYAEVEELLKPSLEFKRMMRDDPAILRFFIKYPANHQFKDEALLSDNDIIFNLLGLNDKFTQTELYCKFRDTLFASYIKDLKSGHVFVEGNYSTLLGNPYEMLQAAIGQFKGESFIGTGNVHTKRFEYGKRILGSRSPHVCAGNVWLTNNVESEAIDKYFNLTTEIVCINSIDENILQRLSGADFDSDTVLLTNNKLLITAAIRNYDRFKVSTNLVTASKVKRYYTSEQQADLDVKTSVNKIGEIVNLSQVLNSLYWDNINKGQMFTENHELYCDICTLNAMSGLEIDAAKKEFAVNNAMELTRMREKYEDMLKDDSGKTVKPYFFSHILKAKSKKKKFYNPNKKAYLKHETAMDYLNVIVDENKYYAPEQTITYLPFSEILNKELYDWRKVNHKVITEIIPMTKTFKGQVKELFAKKEDGSKKSELYSAYIQLREEFVDQLNKITMNHSTMYSILKEIEKEKNKDIQVTLFHLLFSTHNNRFYELIKSSQCPVASIIEDDGGDIEIFGRKYTKKG